MNTPITSSWLRANGFQWNQLEGQPFRHWLLWIGERLQNQNGRVNSHDYFGVEVSKNDAAGTDWFVWFRADYAGRYTRFICAGHISSAEQLTGMIEGIIGAPFLAEETWGGNLYPPGIAKGMRSQIETLHFQQAVSRWRAIAIEEANFIRRKFRDSDWFECLETEDDRTNVVYVNRWPTPEERHGLPVLVAIELAPTGGAQ